MTRVTAESLTAAKASTSPSILEALPPFRRHLKAENKAPRTIESYAEAVRRLGEFLVERGMPLAVASITRDHLEMFMEDQVTRLRPTSAKTRYASLRQFFRYLVEVGELTASPMGAMRPPAVPEAPVPVLSEDQLRAMLRVERDGDDLGRRDAALIRTFIDTGARLAELAGLELEDVNLDAGTLRVVGKGRRERHLPIGSRTVRALDRYLAMRERHPTAVAESSGSGRRAR